MNMKSMILAALGLALFVPAVASAQSTTAGNNIGITASGGMTFYNGGEDIDFSGLTGRVGYAFTDNFGVEVEASVGASDGDVSGLFGAPPGVSVDLGLNSQLSGFVVGYMPLSDQGRLFARLGYSSAELEVSASAGGGSATETLSLDDVIWGLGGEYYFTERFGIRGEVTGFQAEGEDIDSGLDMYQISAVIRF
jgi:outer membrane immunogenic protein